MEPNLEQKIKELDNKVNLIYESVEKTRKYLFWTMVITIVVVVLPIIGLLFAIPPFLNNLDTITNLGL